MLVAALFFFFFFTSYGIIGGCRLSRVPYQPGGGDKNQCSQKKKNVGLFFPFLSWLALRNYNLKFHFMDDGPVGRWRQSKRFIGKMPPLSCFTLIFESSRIRHCFLAHRTVLLSSITSRNHRNLGGEKMKKFCIASKVSFLHDACTVWACYYLFG